LSGAAEFSLSDVSDMAPILSAIAQAALIVNPETGEIVLANQRAAELFLCSVEKLETLVVEDLIPRRSAAEHVALRGKFLADDISRKMARGRAVLARLWDGSEKSLVVSLGNLRIGSQSLVLTLLSDVTETRSRDDSMLHILEALDYIEIGLIILKSDPLVIVHANERACQLSGYDLEDLVGRSLGTLGIAFSEDSLLPESDVKGSSAERPMSEQSIMRQDGLVAPVQIEFARLRPEESSSDGVLMIFRDLLARRRMENTRRASEMQKEEERRLRLVARERDRIARDFHDTVIQQIFGTGLNLQGLAARSEGEVKERLERSIADLDSTITEIRSAIFDLHQPISAVDEVRIRVMQVVREAEQNLGFPCAVYFEGPTTDVPQIILDEMIPVLREGLSNVVKHSRAESVSVTLSADSSLRLSIHDDGVGFDWVGSSPRGRQYGIENMEARALRLEGFLEFKSSKEGGTLLIWQVPLCSGDTAVHSSD
jgi:two-component system sensor histidine kinase DevS